MLDEESFPHDLDKSYTHFPTPNRAISLSPLISPWEVTFEMPMGGGCLLNQVSVVANLHCFKKEAQQDVF